MIDFSLVFLKELFTKMMVSYDLRNDDALDIPNCNNVLSRHIVVGKFGEQC